MYYCGIDPGKNGAMAIVDRDMNIIDVMDWTDNFDEIQDKFSRHNDRLNGLYIRMAILEKVHAMPKQGVKSMFTFGENFGKWQAILAYEKIPYHLMPPKIWQAGLVYTSDGDDQKKRNTKAFHRLFPGQDYWIEGPKGGVKDGRVDAILMAAKLVIGNK